MKNLVAGTKLLGPDGQGYEIVKDIRQYETLMASSFRAFGGAPNPEAGRQMPEWANEELQRLAKLPDDDNV